MLNTKQQVCEFAGRLMRQPTAPYYEHGVRDQVEAILKEQGLKFHRDRYGNVHARLQTASRLTPVVLAAHIDHPGFHVVQKLSNKKWVVRFRGGVPEEWFRAGLQVRLYPGDIRVLLGRRITGDKTFEAEAENGTDALPAFGVWDMTAFSLRGGRIVGRACDDLVGATCILSTLTQLKRSKAKVDVIGVFSRAEEIGFQGALALAADRLLPPKSLVISLETSRELPGSKMGKGVILRVGDKASTFDPEYGRFLAEVAADLAAKDPRFQFQRALMSGGTCEATAYQEYGYRCSAVCIALGNYHNCGERHRILPEFVNVADAESMVELLVHTSRCMPRYRQFCGKLNERLSALLREARQNLQAEGWAKSAF